MTITLLTLLLAAAGFVWGLPLQLLLGVLMMFVLPLIFPF